MTEPPAYDPYDPNRAPKRPVAGPRLVDYTKPLPPPDPGPVVARPHAPQVRIQESEVVPSEDNPMRGWRGLGASLLSRHLWPRDARTNPVMVYYTGRQRGRRVEDFMGLWPWALVLGLDALFFLWGAKSFLDVWAYAVGQFIFLYFFGALCGATMTTFHLRRILDRIPLDELLVTRLKPVDVIQGLSIRPIAVQSAILFLHSILHMILALVCVWRLGKGFTADSYVYLVMFCPFRFYCIRFTVEMGGAMAMRANMCLRALVVASLRMIFDICIVLSVLLIISGVASLVVCFAGACLLPVPFLGPLIFTVVSGFVLTETLRNAASEAMDWCHHYPDEWWINNSSDAERIEFKERTLFTRWEPIHGRRRIFVPRALRSPAPPTLKKKG